MVDVLKEGPIGYTQEPYFAEKGDAKSIEIGLKLLIFNFRYLRYAHAGKE